MTNEPKDWSRSGREDTLRRANSGVETIPRPQIDGSLMGKSFRTLRAGEPVAGMRKAAEVGDDEKKPKEVAGNMTQKTGRKRVAFDQVLVRSERPSHESLPSMSRPTLMEYEKGGKKELSENVFLDSDEESRSDEESYEESSDNDEAASTSAGDGSHDVNKKADEFIAKFREQIRLQRIESIKRSAQISKNLSR
ncbi:hypothetical protein CK203_009157 [Vitis vinifera]|nr:hypothetical protein CK203_009157 [Vitis vinifera]